MARPFFSFYGGKWRDTPKNYPPPEHETIIEPFAGSAGYAMRYYDRRVVLCDIDPVVTGVWSFLIGATAQEIMAIPDVEEGQTVDDLDVPQEARWLVGFWLNRGASRPRRSPSQWMRSGIRPGSFWGPSVRERIAGQVGLIRHWVVVNADYRECPVPNGPATFFVDPPYQTAGHHYHHGSKAINYEDLALWCGSRTGQTIVCEAGDADWLPFEHLADVKSTRAGHRSKEAIWVGTSRRP